VSLATFALLCLFARQWFGWGDDSILKAIHQVLKTTSTAPLAGIAFVNPASHRHAGDFRHGELRTVLRQLFLDGWGHVRDQQQNIPLSRSKPEVFEGLLVDSQLFGGGECFGSPFSDLSRLI
jgi:hypothetical protein